MTNHYSSFRAGLSQRLIAHKSKIKIFFVEHVMGSAFNKYLTLFFSHSVNIFTCLYVLLRCVSIVVCSETRRQTHTFRYVCKHAHSKAWEGDVLVGTSGFECDTIH